MENEQEMSDSLKIYTVLECIKRTANQMNISEEAAVSILFPETYTEMLKMLKASLWWDWKRVIKEIVLNDLDILVIPRNTVLFHGTSLNFPDKGLPIDSSYYASLRSAMYYGFDPQQHGEDPGDYGQILTFRVIKDILILRTTRWNFSKILGKLKEIHAKLGIEGKIENLLYYAYDYSGQRKRFSERDIDDHINKVLCTFVSENDYLTGFGDMEYNSFHDEIVLCSNSVIERLEYTYRFDPSFQECIFILKNDTIISHFHITSQDENDTDLPAKSYKLGFDRETDKYRLSELDNKLDGKLYRNCNRPIDKREDIYPIEDMIREILV